MHYSNNDRNNPAQNTYQPYRPAAADHANSPFPSTPIPVPAPTPVMANTQNMNAPQASERSYLPNTAPVRIMTEEEDAALVKAVIMDDASAVDTLLKNDLQVRPTSQSIISAAQYNNVHIMNLLLQHGANPNFREPMSGQTPLSMMFTKSVFNPTPPNINLAKLLINYGADLNMKDDLGQTPLLDLIKFNDANLVQLMHNKGADFNVQDENGNSAVHVAAQYGITDSLVAMLESGADANLRNKSNTSPLLIAIAEQHLPAIKALLFHGADVMATQAGGVSPFSIAGHIGEKAIFQLIADNAVKLPEVLTKAIKQPELNHATSLLINEASGLNLKDRNGNAPLHIAVKYKNDQIIEQLISKKVDIDTEDKYGYTPFHRSALSGDLDMAKTLLIHGANPKHKIGEKRLNVLDLIDDKDLKYQVKNLISNHSTSIVNILMEKMSSQLKIG